MMRVIVCPGVHDPQLTESFLEHVGLNPSSSDGERNVFIFPAQNYPSYSAVHILQFLRETGLDSTVPEDSHAPLIFVSFSAGVVGAIGAAWALPGWGGQVKAFIAVDGWGVPLYGTFPIHRVSHDYFTHWSSAVLGSGEESFYAQPPVEHLALWRSPQTAMGWAIASGGGHPVRHRTNAAEFLKQRLHDYGARSQ